MPLWRLLPLDFARDRRHFVPRNDPSFLLSLRAPEGGEAISSLLGDCFIAQFTLTLPKGY
ncbi:MAG: hypothetical protein ACE5NP_06175 [Anaerolineae bacterium]